MEHLTLINLLCLFLGISLNALLRLHKKKKQQGEEFDFDALFWIKDNWITATITLLIGLSSIIMADGLIQMMGVLAVSGAPFYKVWAFLSGFAPNVILSHLSKIMGKGENRS